MANPTYNEVLQQAVELAGEVYADATGVVLQIERANLFRSMLSLHFRRVWNRTEWPEACLCEQRYFADLYDAAETGIAADDIRCVADDPNAPVYYVALQAQATAVAVTDAAFWSETTDFVRRVPYEQTDQTEIGTALAAYFPSNPRATTRTSLVDWSLDEAGIVFPAGQAYVWLIFRQEPPVLNAATTGDGNSYTLPRRLAWPTAALAAASICRSEGKPDMAAELERLGTLELEQEADNVHVYAERGGPRLVVTA